MLAKPHLIQTPKLWMEEGGLRESPVRKKREEKEKQEEKEEKEEKPKKESTGESHPRKEENAVNVFFNLNWIKKYNIMK